MKILVRKWNEEQKKLEYVWKKISNKPYSVQAKQFKDVDGDVYTELYILKIVGDKRKTYNVCGHCGKLVKPGDEDKHYEEKEKQINCFECKHLRANTTGKYTKRKFVKQEDGTYIRTVKEEVSVYCNAAYYTKTLEEIKESKNKNCPYFKCRYYGVKAFPESILMKYPKLHEVLITEKTLMENKFSLDYIDDCSHTRRYRHSRFKNLTATVDDNGIIQSFCYTYRNSSYRFVYAKEYDMFFSIDYNEYTEFDLGYYLSTTTLTNIQKLIRGIYTEAEVEGGEQ